MSALTIQDNNRSSEAETLTSHAEIAARLKQIGVQFERWEANQPLAADADQVAVLAAYESQVEKLNQQYGFKSVDVVGLGPDHPDKAAMRQKFLAEHTHDDFEIRFFVDGRGLFYLHVNGMVYMVVCEKCDLISVPANTTHWFDMGENPSFKCIRFFTTENGWEGNFTGSDIATNFPDYDTHVASLG